MALHIEREIEIIALLNQRGSVTVRELVELFDVNEVTVRRDLQKLENRKLLRRTHGGAVRLDSVSTRLLPTLLQPTASDAQVDALILAPVQNRVAHTLRERALRSRIPLLAESVGFDGAIYLGPDNYRGAMALGQWTGAFLQAQGIANPSVLNLTSQLPNGIERSNGFVDGLREVLNQDISTLTFDGRDVYNAAYQVVHDALRLHPEINLLFGVNDDLILAAIQAALDLGRDPDSFFAVNVGGEGKTIFDALQRRGSLKACLALFPEIVGRLAIEGTVRLWAGEQIGSAIITPHAVLTADNLMDYYTSAKQEWSINLQAIEQLEQTRWQSPVPKPLQRRVSFVIHFRTHEWYQNVARAMQERAQEVGVTLVVQDVNEDLKVEISELRRLIGKKAASYVGDGEAIILDAGSTTVNMAHFFDMHHNLTVITNSVAVLQHLHRHPNIHLSLTGGEFHREANALTGRGAQLYLRLYQKDKSARLCVHRRNPNKPFG